MKAYLIDFPKKTIRACAQIAKHLGIARNAYMRHAVVKQVEKDMHLIGGDEDAEKDGTSPQKDS